MSNLIKSGKVIDIGTPVNVGISCTVNELSNVILEKTKLHNDNIQNKVKICGNINNRMITQAEITEQYMKEAENKASEYYEENVRKAKEEGILMAKEEADKILQKANLEYNQILDEIIQIKENAMIEYKKELKEDEKGIIDLAMQIAEKILNYEINRSDEYIIGIVQDAVEKVINKKDVCVKLATQDYYTIQANKKILMSRVKGFGEIELIQDESLETGSCIVDTPLGVIDGSLQVRMDNIQKEVEKLLNEITI